MTREEKIAAVTAMMEAAKNGTSHVPNIFVDAAYVLTKQTDRTKFFIVAMDFDENLTHRINHNMNVFELVGNLQYVQHDLWAQLRAEMPFAEKVKRYATVEPENRPPHEGETHS